MTSGAVEIFFNDAADGGEGIPGVRRQADRRDRHAVHRGAKASTRCTIACKPTVKIVMPIVTQFYGMREFAIEDPDGYVITFAERYVIRMSC